MKIKIKEHAFTLIELLVVIMIIGVLTSILLVVFQSYRSHARDAQRISDLKRIAAALSVYYSRHNAYPPDVAEGQGTWSSWECGNAINNSSFSFLPQLVSDGEMSAVPVETYWNSNTAGSANDPWGVNGAECSYRYQIANFSPICGIQYSGVAALYGLLENARPADGVQPSCISSWWGEASAGDPNGYLIIIK